MPSTCCFCASRVSLDTWGESRAAARSTEYDVSRVQTWFQLCPAINEPFCVSAAITPRAFKYAASQAGTPDVKVKPGAGAALSAEAVSGPTPHSRPSVSKNKRFRACLFIVGLSLFSEKPPRPNSGEPEKNRLEKNAERLRPPLLLLRLPRIGAGGLLLSYTPSVGRAVSESGSACPM